MKGIILAGGHGTRLYPITKGVCKQLLPVYDKPMIYYPLSVLMEAGIHDILIITLPNAIESFQGIFGDGSSLGISITYAAQAKPRGIAEAFIVGEEFIGKDSVCLILGDNIFFGHGLASVLQKAAHQNDGATIFGYYVNDPERYGIIQFGSDNHISKIVEKPSNPISHWAVTGLYFYNNEVIEMAKSLKPSKRKELEITDINNIYLERHKLNVELLEHGYAWLDTGTYDALVEAAMFIKTIEDRQGLKIGCIEEIAFHLGYIDKQQLKKIAHGYKTSYGKYLLQLSNRSR